MQSSPLVASKLHRLILVMRRNFLISATIPIITAFVPPTAATADPPPPAFTFTPGESSRASGKTPISPSPNQSISLVTATTVLTHAATDADLPLHDLDTHECTIRKERRKTARDHSCSKDKLCRSARLAGKEAKYSPMLAKAVKAKAARLSAADVGSAIDCAIHDTRLDLSDAPPASAEDLATIALLCGADDDHVDAILEAEGLASGADDAP